MKGCDIASFDVYPVVGIRKPDGENYLWYVAKGVERLMRWTEGRKVVWNCVECTHISNPHKRATPAQVRAEVWMALIHGSRGLIWFVHQFKPRFNEHALLDDPEMLAAVTAINRRIRSLAPVLNSPALKGVATVSASPKTPAPAGVKEAPGADETPIRMLVQRHDGSLYLFTVCRRNRPARAAFRVAGLPERARVEVIGEERTIDARGGRFEDSFDAWGVHLYRIRE